MRPKRFSTALRTTRINTINRKGLEQFETLLPKPFFIYCFDSPTDTPVPCLSKP